MTKGRQLSSFKGIDLNSKIRDEVRNHERGELIYLGFDVIQFLVNFYLCWKRFCCWFDLGGYEFPPLFTKKRFTLISMEVVSSESVCYRGSLICLVPSCSQELWNSLTY